MNTIRIFLRMAILFFASAGICVFIGPALDKPLTRLIDWLSGLIRGKS